MKFQVGTILTCQATDSQFCAQLERLLDPFLQIRSYFAFVSFEIQLFDEVH